MTEAAPKFRPAVDSVERTLTQIGDAWTFLILREAYFGVRRFDGFLNGTGAAPGILTGRLRKLVANGLLERRQYTARPPRFEYRLSAKGLDLYPVIVLMMQWGDRWLADDRGPPIQLIHRSCGRAIAPALNCNHCCKEIVARDMDWQPGPNASATAITKY